MKLKKKIYVSTPSRICLFGEHQDYLNLEVIASAINLRFSATAVSRDDKIVRIRIRDEKYDKLNDVNSEKSYNEWNIDLTKPIIYDSKRDYIKSTINTLMKRGYDFEHGYDIVMDSEVPIGKGMSSSTTMIIVLIKALLEAMDSKDKDDAEKIALLGHAAEVLEFNEPGGLMDHYASALGGLVHLTFNKDNTEVRRINRTIPGCFILFDSKAQKNTTMVLANAKTPVVNGLSKLNKYGITSIRDFVRDEANMKYLSNLDSEENVKIRANIDNYRILKEAQAMLDSDSFSPEKFGELLKRHHANLRDGLNISTPAIEEILETSYKHGALGGKINGSGGGGCGYVYASDEDSERIVKAIESIGYLGRVIRQDTGVRKDKEEII